MVEVEQSIHLRTVPVKTAGEPGLADPRLAHPAVQQKLERRLGGKPNGNLSLAGLGLSVSPHPSGTATNLLTLDPFDSETFRNGRASSGMKNDKIISDCPELKVVLNEPIPKLVSSESNRFTVASELTLESAESTTLTKPSFPLLNEVTAFPC